MRVFTMIVFACVAIVAQDVTWTATDFTEGPRLVFRHQVAVDAETMNVHEMIAPGIDAVPRTFARTPLAMIPQLRLDARHLVMSADAPLGRIFTVDLATGQTDLLIAGRGVRALTAGAGSIVYRNGRELFVQAMPRKTERPAVSLGAAIAISPPNSAGFAAILGEVPAHVWFISPDGGTRTDLGALDGVRETSFGVSVKLAPNGRRVAVGAPIDQIGWCLTVFSRDGAKPARVLENVSIEVSPLSSELPSFEFRWLDDAVIRFSETRVEERGIQVEDGEFQWVDIDVDRRQRLAERPYAKLGLRHQPPPESRPARSLAGSRPTPPDPADASETLIDARGRWSAVVHGPFVEHPGIDLVDLSTQVSRRVFDGVALDVKWLP